MAATASSAFLLPPVGSAPLPTVPPKVNEGAGADCVSIDELFALTSGAFLAGAAADETIAAGVSSTGTLGFDSRAGAVALAALDPAPAPEVIFEAELPMGVATSGKCAFSGAGSEAAACAAISTEAAATLGCGSGICVRMRGALATPGGALISIGR
jgi:hypothetical protein